MESLRNNLPLISLCLLIIGTANLLVYYDYFDIDVLSYLDLTEVLQLQFKFFAGSVLYLLAFVFYVLLTPSSTTPNPHEIAARLEAELKKTQAVSTTPEPVNQGTDKMDVEATAKKIHDNLREKDVPFTAMIVFAAFAAIGYWWTNIRKEQSILVHSLMWVELILLPFVLYFAYKQMQKNFIEEHFAKEFAADISRKIILINVLLVLAFAAAIKAREDAMEVLASPSYFEVTAQLEDTTLVTNINYRFVGKTKNNIFFYNLKKHQAEVYSSDKMKSFVIRDRRKL
jgi:hypothetical protein